MPDLLVEVVGLTKTYGAMGGSGTQVLKGVELTVAAGESVAVVGPSGSGKSTLLDIIGALQPASSGQVRVLGRDLSTLGADELAALRNRDIGYVFQAHHLLPQCTALENVLVPTLVNPDRKARRAAVERGRALLVDVGLGDRGHHRPAELSGGERQRVAVVRALINEPRLLLADEPTGSLDAAAADQLGELLCRLNREQGIALLTVTHAPDLAARLDRIFELRDGRLIPCAPAS